MSTREQRKKTAILQAMTDAVLKLQDSGEVGTISRQDLFLAAAKFVSHVGMVCLDQKEDEDRAENLHYMQTILTLTKKELEKGEQLTRDEVRAIAGETWDTMEGEDPSPLLKMDVKGVH